MNLLNKADFTMNEGNKIIRRYFSLNNNSTTFMGENDNHKGGDIQVIEGVFRILIDI